MAAIVTNEDTERCLRGLLVIEGNQLSPERAYGETGVDIIAERGDECLHIEVIGYKESGPARSKDFYEGFFRTVSRLKDGASALIFAMPANYRTGLPARAKQYGEAWIRIGEAFPELEIWLIDVERNTCEKCTWNQWYR